MKALLRKASDYRFEKEIEINTLEELLKIYKDLIIYTDLDRYDKEKYDFEVVIYDDWWE